MFGNKSIFAVWENTKHLERLKFIFPSSVIPAKESVCMNNTSLSRLRILSLILIEWIF